MANSLDSSDRRAVEIKGKLFELSHSTFGALSLEKQQSSKSSYDTVEAFDDSQNNGKHSAAVQEDTLYGAVQGTYTYFTILANKRKMGFPEIQESFKKQDEGQVQYSEKCALKIQVVDHTALIEPSFMANGKFSSNSNGSRRIRNRQETQGKKENKPQRKGGKAGKCKKTLEEGVHAHASVETKGKKRLAYSRKEMDALRFVDLVDQKKKWIEVYGWLGALVAQEYDGLVNSANIPQKRIV